ncbi:MAG TPA: DUF3006 domain-containing protein [Clostridiales bacterium]|nr:DUF3006 domain-containing protein [Clostridiales bacterium]
MIFAVDRLEGDYAVCVAAPDPKSREIVFSLPVPLFPSPPREGDVYRLSLEPEPSLREQKEQTAKEKLNKLFGKNKSQKGDKQDEN